MCDVDIGLNVPLLLIPVVVRSGLVSHCAASHLVIFVLLPTWFYCRHPLGSLGDQFVCSYAALARSCNLQLLCQQLVSTSADANGASAPQFGFGADQRVKSVTVE